MIKLAFLTLNKKVIRFEINNRIIQYYDSIWKYGIQFMPLDVNLVKDMMLSGKRDIKIMAKLIRDTNSGEELEEYNNCKTEEELAEMVRKDCRKNGLMEIKIR